MKQRAALFLDRDGIINVDHGYIGERERFEWRPGIFDLARAGIRAGMKLIVITNQSGIARGLFDEEAYENLTRWMEERFVAEGAPLTAVYHCPFHPEATVTRYRMDHPWRKPHPGMILAAQSDFDLDLSAATLIGDQWTDIEAGRSAGVGTCVLVGVEQSSRPARGICADIRLVDVEHAARWFGARVAI